MKQHGPWKIVASQTVYRDPWLVVRKDDVIRPDGNPGTHSVVEIRPGVCVLALDDEGHAYLTEEFHYAVGRVTLEAVSGGIEDGEDPLTTAKRELREELGIEADSWLELGVVDPFTSGMVSPTRLYLARDLRFDTPKPEGTELIRCVRMPFVDAVDKVIRSEITHGPSCVLIFKVWLQVSDHFL